GPLTRLTNSSRTYNFPVGADGIVRTVLVSPDEETNAAYTVYYHHATTPDNGSFDCTNLMANQDNEFWDLSRSANSSNAFVQLEYVNPSDPKSWSNRTNPSETSNVAIIQNTTGK